MMKNSRNNFILCLLFLAITYPSSLLAEVKPNIIYVLFDDLGYGQPPSYNRETTFKMPNFERVVKEGMRFTDAHSASGVCTPTRYGIITGRYPSRIGQFGVLTTWSKPIIPTSRQTVASFLKAQGYETACIGKWHLGLNWETQKNNKKTDDSMDVPIGTTLNDGPNSLGFNYFTGFTHARNITTIIENNKVIEYINAVDQQPRMIKEAVSWLKERKSTTQPFFLYFPMCPPHTPVIPSADFLGKSKAVDLVGKDPKYGDWILQGDDMLGQILQTLDDLGLADNTLLIVTSDNGAAGRPYPPLRESKSSVYEGGHRVPFAVRWPGVVKPESQCHATICHNDFLATIADLLHVSLPPDAGEDSISILPLLKDPSTPPTRPYTIHQSASGVLAIRSGPWKLIFKGGDAGELYHLGDDISETKNVAKSKPEIVTELTNLMQAAIKNGRSNPGPVQTIEYDITQKLTGKRVKN